MTRRPPPLPAPSLPVDAALPALVAAVAQDGRAVLVAPPGAGKTTRVPLALLGQVAGRIVMLEPRRLAARAAAQRLAEALGEAPGGQIGFRIRGESVPGRRIEVVTEGILTRMLQSDPSLPGIGALIFDEFHERSLNADLGLALAWEARGALRPDLTLVVMSATLDAGPVAALLDDAPVIRAEGRAFPVETRWLPRPLAAGVAIEAAMADLIAQAFRESGGQDGRGGEGCNSEDRRRPPDDDRGRVGESSGDGGHTNLRTETDPPAAARGAAAGTTLAFLPGEREIRRVAAALSGLDADILPLYGALPFAAQQAALTPPKPGRRRIVLATAIAETSLTIPGVTVVVDAGRARRARFDPGTGMSRLVTERASKAEADQRRGRAGRVAAGLCYRLWARAEEGAMAAFAPPEIETADLAPLALELACWGSPAGEGLAFLTPPPAAGLAAAQEVLRDLGAVDGQGRITGHGRRLAALPLHPRLGHMLMEAGAGAANLAALMGERDPLRGAGADLGQRLAALRGEKGPWQADPGVLGRIRAQAARLRRLAPRGASHQGLSPGAMLSLAWPDRIGMRRPGEAARFILAGGRGAVIDAADPLQGAHFIVAADLDGAGREARIRRAAPLGEDELRTLHAGHIRREDRVEWDSRTRRVQALRRERLGALTLSEVALADPPPEALAQAALAGLRDLGLPWDEAALRLRARMALAGEDVSDEALLADPDWLLPFIAGARTAAQLRGIDLAGALNARLGHAGRERLERIAPAHFTTPLGRKVAIDYGGEVPSVSVRLPELYGLTRHPQVGGQPLRIALLSPAGRPVQVTTDLPGFWDTSYAEVRKEMRGRYPRHPWPEDPRAAPPTTRAKPRGQ